MTQAFTQAFGADRVHQLAPVPASEDFGLIPSGLRRALHVLGQWWLLPGMPVVGNHNPAFAPAIQPTVRTGTEAAIAATLAYVS